jgi:hypothetical protein
LSTKGASTEYLFDVEALEHGLMVCKPQWDSSYDRIVDFNGKLTRVQIKETSAAYYNRFKVTVDGKYKTKYAGNIDYLAIYIKPKKAWFFIPFEDITVTQLNISEESHSQYANKWEVFQ